MSQLYVNINNIFMKNNHFPKEKRLVRRVAFFFDIFARISLGLREDSWILLSTLHSVCCINTCHVASGKHHCILIKRE